MSIPKQELYLAGRRGAWISLTTYAVMAAIKLSAGAWTGSRALTADGVNNVTDVASCLAVLLGLHIALRPADVDHHYGHQRAETVAAIIVSAVMVLVGLNLLVDAITGAFSAPAPPQWPAIYVALATGAAAAGLYTYNLRLARRTGSSAIYATALDNLSDSLISFGAGAGVVGARLGYAWTDSAAAVIVALIIIHTAWHIGARAAHNLTDGFDQERAQHFVKTVEGVNGVSKVAALRARQLGLTVAVDVTIRVAPNLSIVEAHRVADAVETALRRDSDISQVHVHVEPDQKPGLKSPSPAGEEPR